MEAVLRKTFGTFSVDFLVLVYSISDATENCAATFIKPVSDTTTLLSFWVISSSEPMSVCIKLSSLSNMHCCMFVSIEIHLHFSITRASFFSPQLAFNFTGKKVLPWKTWYPEKTLLPRCSCPSRAQVWTWLVWLPGGIPRWHPAALNCPAFVPCLSTTSLSVREHSLASHDSTVSWKVFDGGPCLISFGNTNRLYQLKLPYSQARCFLQRTLSKELGLAIALRVMAKAVLTFAQNIIFIHVASNSVLC